MDVGDWAVRQCCEIRLRAERKWRQLYNAGQKAKGQGERGADGQFHQRSNQSTAGPKTLSDLGITRDQSSQWQKLAAGTQPQFEAPLARRGRS
jgi:hypothetical protein